MTESEVVQFGNIKLGGKYSGAEGILKINNHGIGWKNKADASETLEGNSIVEANWLRVLKSSFELELKLKNGSTIKFDGFREQDHETIKRILKHNFGVDVQSVELATKGWNWGDVDFQGNSLYFTMDGKRCFEVPLSDVSRSVLQNTIASKNDVSLEFHQDDVAEETESLVEIRFHFPAAEKDEKQPAQSFLEKVLSKADTVSTSGKGILLLGDLPVLTPRGRYSIEMFPAFLRLHGKTYDYKIQYKHISRLFQLPKPDQRYVYFVISMDPPIKQGQTRYPHVVLLFSKDETTEVTVSLTKDTAEKYKELAPGPDDNGKLKGKTFDLVSKAFKVLSGKKITIPNNFKSAGGATAVKCALKANDGFLYPLERSFFFVHKPPTHIRFEDITLVEFARVSSAQSSTSNRTFDVVITLKNGNIFQFTGIQRAEYNLLYNFITSKKLQVKVAASMEEEAQSVLKEAAAALDEEESEDEDFVAGEEEDVPEEFEDSEEDDDFGEDEDDDDEEVEEKKPKKEKVEKKRRASDEGSSEKKKHKKDKKDKKESKDKKEKKSKKEKKPKESKEKKDSKDKKETKDKKEKKEKKPKEVKKEETKSEAMEE